MEKHILVHSAWITIQVAPLPPGKRQAWLASLRSAKPADPVEWLSDYLPSLLAVPDRAVLPLLKDAVYHPNELVRQYALYSLALFDDTLLASWLPSAIQASGPTLDLAYFLKLAPRFIPTSRQRPRPCRTPLPGVTLSPANCRSAPDALFPEASV